MKTNKLPLIGLERFKEYPDHIIYMDENIAMIDSFTEMIKMDETFVKLDCFMIVFCLKGNISININGQQHMLSKEHCAILPHGTIIRKLETNHIYKIRIAAISQNFIAEVFSITKETWNIFHYLYHNPIHSIKSDSSYKIYLYKELLMRIIQEKPHAYSKQTRRFVFAGMFNELMAMINEMVPDNIQSDVNRSRSSIIVRDFIDLVNSDDGSHRSVSYYADLLCYSPKHLSNIVKQVTNKSPLQIINKHAIQEIKFKLKHSNSSIKEIADFFNFPNPSFFGKYVKIHTGMSPLQYRMSDKQ